MANIHSFIARYVHKDLRSQVKAAVELAELKLDPIDRYYSLPQALDEAFGIDLADDEIASWVTVRDVERGVFAQAGD